MIHTVQSSKLEFKIKDQEIWLYTLLVKSKTTRSQTNNEKH